jgi:hypothetical protein
MVHKKKNILHLEVWISRRYEVTSTNPTPEVKEKK